MTSLTMKWTRYLSFVKISLSLRKFSITRPKSVIWLKMSFLIKIFFFDYTYVLKTANIFYPSSKIFSYSFFDVKNLSGAPLNFFGNIFILSQIYPLISNFVLDFYQKIVNDSIGVLKTKNRFSLKMTLRFSTIFLIIIKKRPRVWEFCLKTLLF